MSSAEAQRVLNTTQICRHAVSVSTNAKRDWESIVDTTTISGFEMRSGERRRWFLDLLCDLGVDTTNRGENPFTKHPAVDMTFLAVAIEMFGRKAVGSTDVLVIMVGKRAMKHVLLRAAAASLKRQHHITRVYTDDEMQSRAEYTTRPCSVDRVMSQGTALCFAKEAFKLAKKARVRCTVPGFTTTTNPAMPSRMIVMSDAIMVSHDEKDRFLDRPHGDFEEEDKHIAADASGQASPQESVPLYFHERHEDLFVELFHMVDVGGARSFSRQPVAPRHELPSSKVSSRCPCSATRATRNSSRNAYLIGP